MGNPEDWDPAPEQKALDDIRIQKETFYADEYGAHVVNDQNGSNSLITSDGFYVRDGDNVMSSILKQSSEISNIYEDAGTGVNNDPNSSLDIGTYYGANEEWHGMKPLSLRAYSGIDERPSDPLATGVVLGATSLRLLAGSMTSNTGIDIVSRYPGGQYPPSIIMRANRILYNNIEQTPVVDSGTVTVGLLGKINWKLLSDNTFVAKGRLVDTTDATWVSGLGGVETSRPAPQYNYPFALAARPLEFCEIHGSYNIGLTDGFVGMAKENYIMPTTTRSGSYYGFRVTAGGNCFLVADYLTIGKKA